MALPPMPGMPTPGAPPPGFPAPGGPPPGAGGPPPPGTGAAAAPGAQAGTHAQAMGQVKTGLEMFMKALPGIPIGSKLHEAVMKTISSVVKELTSGDAGPGDVMQNLVGMARQAQADPARMAAMRAIPPAPGGGMPAGMAPPPSAAAA